MFILKLTLPWLYLLIILWTLIGVAIGRYPYFQMNRAVIALVGATLLVLLGALSLEQAYAAVDGDILLLLFAMMVINVNLSLAGFFRLVTAAVVRLAHTPRQLLGIIILTSGVLSALFLNDVIVLMFTPLVVELAAALRRNPLPYLIGLVSAANIGSTATITGNPQNMLIGLSSGLSYLTFSSYLAPVALVGLGIAWGVLVWLYPNEFRPQRFEQMAELPRQVYRPLLWKSVIATVLMIIGFILEVPIPLAAMGAAALLLTTRRLKPRRIFRELDWSLLVFFTALFVVTEALNTTGFSAQLFKVMRPMAERGVAVLSLTAAVLSNLVLNVPAVMLFRPLIPGFPDPPRAWLTLAMSTTLAGNLTLLGSMANLIVAELARNRGVILSFREYLRAGVLITLTTLGVGILWLTLAP